MTATGIASGLLGVGGFAYLLLFSSISVSPSLGDKRNAPIRLRENLWATGHFMGKKSSPHFQTSSQERAEANNIPEAFKPVLRDVLDIKDLLMRELLESLLQERLLEGNQGKRDPKGRETPSLMKLLTKYI